jgi:hypothetical protein
MKEKLSPSPGSFAVKPIARWPMIDEQQTALETRIALIADVLGLGDEEVNAVIDSTRADSIEELVAFVQRHHQDFDWVCAGSVRGMIRKLAAGRQP